MADQCRPCPETCPPECECCTACKPVSLCKHTVAYPAGFAPDPSVFGAFRSTGETVEVSAWVEITALCEPVRTFMCTVCQARKTEEYEEEEWPWQ